MIQLNFEKIKSNGYANGYVYTSELPTEVAKLFPNTETVNFELDYRVEHDVEIMWPVIDNILLFKGDVNTEVDLSLFDLEGAETDILDSGNEGDWSEDHLCYLADRAMDSLEDV